jgi:hypothetical protein
MYGAVAFTIAAGVHVASYTDLGITPGSPLFWILHLAIFPLFFIFVARLRVWLPGRPSPFRFSLLRDPQWRQLLTYFPAWILPAISILFAYAMVNFVVATGFAPPAAADGSGHGTLDPVHTLRAFSGHWLIFYALPTLFFLYVPAEARPTDGAASDPAASAGRFD